jgi:hypothetical protein
MTKLIVFLTFYDINTLSSEHKIQAGVPQGCICSPTLFSVFLADLNKNLTCENGQYADDISIWKEHTCIKEIEKILQTNINVISAYSQTWCIALSEEKTTHTTLTRAGKRKNYEKTYKMNLQIRDTSIRLDTLPKLLGFHLDPKLSFHSHFSIIENKIQKRVNLLRTLKGRRWSSKQGLLLNYYKACIRPILEYSSTILSCADKHLINKIQVLENKILRLCTTSHYTESNARVHEKSDICNITDRLKESHFKYIKKHLNNQDNKLILRHIAKQPDINKRFSAETARLLKRRKNCLDDFMQHYPNHIEEFAPSQ